MQLSNNEWSEMVFKRAQSADLSQKTMDVELTNVFWAIDGKRSLGDIASTGNYDFEHLLDKVQQLVSIGLIEAKPTKAYIVPRVFMNYVVDRLSKDIGPMSEFLVADTTEDLGYQISNFPAFKLPELVNSLATEIGDPEKSHSFSREILSRIQADQIGGAT
jgi:hypothetical protein